MAFVSALLLPSVVLAQEEAPAAEKDPMARFKAFQSALQQVQKQEPAPNLLQQLIGYRALAEAYPEEDFQHILASFIAWKASAVGAYADAHAVSDRLESARTRDEAKLEIWRRSLDGFEPVDAVEAVTRAAQDRKAVFINEGHHVPQTRVLTWRLLAELRRLGFTHFAAETLYEDGAVLAERGFPGPKTGTYLDEPLYADMVRHALQLGFKVVHYDTGGRPDTREPGQAENLKTRVFDVDPEARLVVHLGYSHNDEGADAFRGVGAMASFFQRLTGIDPLTVDQTAFYEKSSPELEHPFYHELCGLQQVSGAVAFRRQDGRLWTLPDHGRDITVCLPRSTLIDGRPTWLGLGGARRPVPIPTGLCGDRPVCLVEARLAAEGDDGIPMDRVEVRAGDEPPSLMLRPGAYVVRASFDDGTSTDGVAVDVADAGDAGPAVELGWDDFLKRIQEIGRKPGPPLSEQLALLDALSRDYPGKDFQGIIIAFIPWKLSAVGRYAEAEATYERWDASQPSDGEPSDGESSDGEVGPPSGFDRVDGLEAVLDAAAGRQVVMINEAHHVPRHRAFTTRLLPRLKAAGFTHFAAEVLCEPPGRLEARGYPKDLCSYLDEPVYADLVRQALALGFKVVPYEAGGGSKPEIRELGQAKNLKARVFDVDPQARLVVHLGYSHNLEGAESFHGVGAMAYQLRLMTGLDPLTVDQTTLNPAAAPDHEHPSYAALCGSVDGTWPVAFVSPGKALWALPGEDRDLSLCWPRGGVADGRPTWLAMDGARRAVAIPTGFCGAASSCVVEARLVNEGEDGIPMDRVEVRAGEAVPSLMLRPGRYELQALFTDGSPPRRAELGVPEL